MKSNVLKTILPLAVVVVGLTSAAGTSSLSRKSVAQQGYRHIANPESCNAVQQCDEAGNFNCKIGASTGSGAQLYDSNCVTPLKRSTNN